MRKWLVILAVIPALLAGCGARETFENVTDQYAIWDVPAAQILLELPDNAAVYTFGAEDGSVLYLCDGYSISVQTLPGSEIAATLQELSGYDAEDLQVLETSAGDCTRYECGWSSMGEKGNLVCRAAVLSDGCYHYALTAMAEEERAGDLAETIRQIFSTFSIRRETVSTEP